MRDMRICVMRPAAQANVVGQVTLMEISRLLQVFAMPELPWNTSSRWSAGHVPTCVPTHGSKSYVILD